LRVVICIIASIACAISLSHVAAPCASASPNILDVDEALAEAALYRGWEVSSLTVSGIEKPQAEALRRGLALSGRKGFLRTQRQPLFAGTLESDVRRALIFLAQRGYPWAQVGIQMRPNRNKRRIEITLAMTPGPAVKVAELDIVGLPDHLDESATRGAPLRRGTRFSEADLAQAVSALVSIVAAAGYPEVDVNPHVAMLDSSRIEVRLNVHSGPRCVFDETRVSGVPKDLLPLAIRNIHPGRDRLYSPAHLRDARRNLRELDLFRRMDLKVGEPHNDKVDLLAELVPRKPRSTEIDLGYWTDDFLRAGARWRHRNLLRGGRGAEIKAVASRFRREGTLSLWWPTLMGPRTRLTTRFQVTREYEEGYDLASERVELWALKRVGTHGYLQAGLSVADVRVDAHTQDQNAFLEQGGLLTTLHLRVNLDDVDDLIDPTSGRSWYARLEWSPPGLPSDNSYALGQAEAVWYRRLSDAVLAARLEVGLAGPLGDSLDLLPNKRFFAGGANSMRGARRRMLGPLDGANAPVGGESLLLASAELRFPLKGLMGAALFADAGNVWRLSEETTSRDLEFAAGPGLLFATPVGPVRVDAAFNLTSRPAGEPRVVLHVSVGHPF